MMLTLNVINMLLIIALKKDILYELSYYEVVQIYFSLQFIETLYIWMNPHTKVSIFYLVYLVIYNECKSMTIMNNNKAGT